MIYALGDVSGGHFNPAVTLAILLAEPCHFKDDPRIPGFYIATQIFGGIVGAYTHSLILGGRTVPLGPAPGHFFTQVFVGEVIFTFVLCYVVLCTAVKHTKSKSMFGLAIASCVTVGGFAIGSLGGGCLNPAVAFALAASCPTCGFSL